MFFVLTKMGMTLIVAVVVAAVVVVVVVVVSLVIAPNNVFAPAGNLWQSKLRSQRGTE